MEIKKKEFDIIVLYAAENEYFPSQDFIEDFKEYWSEDELKTKFVYSDLDIPLGQSRYGGPVIDIPKNTAFPIARDEFDHPTYDISKDGFDANYLRFVAQFDMSEVGPYDQTALLPQKGQLYFFADIYNEKCKVFYIDVANDDLERIVVKHRDNFYQGCLIERFASKKERFEDHLRVLNEEAGELECADCGEDLRRCDCNAEYNEFKKEDITSDGKVWDAFVGGETSKFFGIFTEYQASSLREIEEMTFSNEMLLLQIGENGFNDEGVFYVSIPHDDLKNMNFEHCKCRWSQT